MSLIIKYATRGRPQWFMRAISNMYATISPCDMKIIVSVDEDDLTMNNQPMRDFMDAHEHIVYRFGKSKSKIEAINTDMDLAGDWKWLINMSDDMVFVQQGWNNIMRQAIKDYWGKSLKFFAHFNDGYVGEALATMSIIGRDYYELDKYIYYPEYKSFSCDAEAWFVARARGCHHYFPEILFKHQHPTWTPMPKDETYTINSKHTPNDLEVYWRRLNANFGLSNEIQGPYEWDKYKTKW